MKRLCKNKHWKLNKDYDIDKILYLLIDRPNRIGCYGEFSYKDNEYIFHRNRNYGLPSIL